MSRTKRLVFTIEIDYVEYEVDCIYTPNGYQVDRDSPPEPPELEVEYLSYYDAELEDWVEVYPLDSWVDANYDALLSAADKDW